jgi:predicted DNA-binding transcriptional regulator AlpA
VIDCESEIEITDKMKEQANDILDVLAEKIADKMDGIPFEERIFNADEAAAYMRVSRYYFMNTIKKITGFPSPCRWSGKERMSDARWFAADIRDWMRKNT